MNLAKAFGGGHPSVSLGMLQSWESQEGAHTPSGSKTPIAICGWLLKMKREHRKFRSTWNRRWFTVEDGAFHWYKTSSSDACGRLSLMDITSVRKFEGAGQGNFTFVVHATDRDVLLRADSANDESRWIRGLTLQIDLIHGGTFQGPPSAKNRRRTVLRVIGEDSGGLGGGEGVAVGREGSAYPSQKPQREKQDREWKGRHFREINDRIRAIMDDRDDGPTGDPRDSTGGVRGSNGGGDGGGGGDDDEEEGSSCSTSTSPVQIFKMTPREARGNSGTGTRAGQATATKGAGSAGGPDGSWRRGQARVVPLMSPRSPPAADDGQDSEHRGESSGGRRRSANGGGGGGGGGKTPQPPAPSGPPPANARGRTGSAHSVTPRTNSSIVDIADSSDDEEDSDGHWGWHNGPRGVQRGGGRGSRSPVGDGHGTPRQRRRGTGRRKEDSYGVGGDTRGEGRGRTALQLREEMSSAVSHQASRKGGAGRGSRRDQPEFEDLDGCSSDQSVRTRDAPFMDDFYCADSARSSGSSPHQYDNGRSLPSDRTNGTATNNGVGGGQDGKNGANALRGRCDGNYDDDEASTNGGEDGRCEKPIATDKASSYWPRSGYGGGGGGSAARGSSGGSATAEDSWSMSLGRGYDDETPSSSRVGSSGRKPCSSRPGSQNKARPSRRYLVEQNRLREEW